MPDVWKAEVSFDAPLVTIPTAAATTGFPAGMNLSFVAGDATHSFMIIYGIREHSIAGPAVEYQSYAEYYWASPGSNDPYQGPGIWNLLTTLTEADGNDGGEWRNNQGTMSITKDESADTISFATPLGTYTTSYVGAPIFDTDSQLRPRAISLESVIPNPFISDQILDVFWFGFWGSKNGVRYMGAPLSAAQPGTWLAWAQSSATTQPATFTNTQTSTREESKIQRLSTDVGAYSTPQAWHRDWNGGDTIQQTVREIDLTYSPEHGVVWAAYTTSAEPETLFLKTSFDDGQSWVDGVVSSVPGQVVTGPNLACFAGMLVAVWDNGTDVVLSISRTFGNTWSIFIPVITPLDNPARPAWPRFIVHPSNGLAYFFFIDNGGNLKLKRSGNFGATFTDAPTPLAVFAGIGNQRIDASVGGDERIRVRFQAVGLEEALWSADYGFAWQAYVSGPLVNVRPQQVFDRRSGLSFHVRWDSGSSQLTAYESADYGASATLTGVVAGGIPEQNADIENLPGGGQIVAYFDNSETFRWKRSFDFAQTWA